MTFGIDRPSMNGGPGSQDSSGRRLADVFVPRCRRGLVAAWDFAVTSGLRLDALAVAVQRPDGLMEEYENFKGSYKHTYSLCQNQGVTFIPMVIEAVGVGWAEWLGVSGANLPKNRLWPWASFLLTTTAPSCSGSSCP